jgi:DNA polymerase-1
LFEWCAENKKTKELKTLEDLAACVKQNWLYGSHCKNMLRMLEPRDLPEPSHTSHLKKLPAFNTVHPSYQLMTRTGRASAKEPPIHNIPGKADVKKMYVSRWMNRGGTIMLVDYSQFELRVMAALSGDEAMMSIFEEDRDIHTAIAAMCLGVPESEITKDIRKRYKAVVFGMIYGRSAKAMAATEKMTIEEAQEIIDSVFRRFKGMANWIENQQLEAQRTNEVWTPWGRRRIMPKAFGFEKGRLNRVAVNTPIQGSASDTTLTAMGAIDPRLSGEGCRSLQIAFIHDALMFDVFPGELAKVHKIVREEMSDNVQKRAPWFKVPAKVEFQVGTSWGRQITFNRREDGVFIFEAEEEVGKEFWKKDFNLLKEALVKSDIKRFYGYETREEGKKRFHQMFAEPA